jgi:hypothetical protein
LPFEDLKEFRSQFEATQEEVRLHPPPVIVVVETTWLFMPKAPGSQSGPLYGFDRWQQEAALKNHPRLAGPRGGAFCGSVTRRGYHCRASLA